MRRQWGAERRTKPLASQHDVPSVAKMTMSRLAIVCTVGFWVMYVVSVIIRQFFDGPHSYSFTMQAIGYLVVVTFLTFSALLYLVARQGALRRFGAHVRVPRAELDRYFSEHSPSITVLIPAASEEPHVVRKTILSAALQEYAGMRIAVLIDNDPHPKTSVAAEKLADTRGLASEVKELLAKPRERFAKALAQFELWQSSGRATNLLQVARLAREYTWAATWLTQMAEDEIVEDHVDVFFRDQVLLALASELSLTAEALTSAHDEGARLPAARMTQMYRRLASIFDAEITTFERKQYVSLSHERNKAMNLNSYIGLMGGQYVSLPTPDGPMLVCAGPDQTPDLIVDDSEFLLTLDADSILLRDYCLRLVYFLQQPGNERVAVTQTPYSSFRGASTRLERLAAATTDIQHILHQGMSQFGATFWVGANAVIRKVALDDIAESEWVGGFEIKRFVQDRTVIEDTESSVDLARHGWRLVNYPERLSYSATPPDFGSLIVQRRRWANGGLLILPKLWAQTRERTRRGEVVSRTEFALRLNYMASIAWASFGLIFLLAYPYDGRLLSPLVLLAAMPYFMAMASDLKYCGYKRSDVLRIYGFNLILLPVNLAGVLKSLQQALSGKKIPFARTPKVRNRTISPLIYVTAPFLIVAFSVLTLWRDAVAQNWANAAFAGFNAVLASWAIIACIGLGSSIVDIWLGLTRWMYVDIKPTASAPSSDDAPGLDWRAVLYHGEATAAVPFGETIETAVERRVKL